MALTTLSYIDHSGETASFSVHTPDLDAGNVEDYTNPNVGGHLGNLRLAAAALTLCNETGQTVQAARFSEVAVPPANENAQRERKLLIQYVDTVFPQIRGSLEIPGINLALVAQTGTDEVDFVNNLLVSNFVNALEDDYVSRIGNPIQVVSARHVGRNI